MLTKFKKKVAIGLVSLLTFQLASVGLAATPTKALAAGSLDVSTNINKVDFVAGVTNDFNFTVKNDGETSYKNVSALITVKDTDASNIESLTYNSGKTPTPVSMVQAGTDLEAAYNFGNIDPEFNQTYDFSAKFATPKSYDVNVIIYEQIGEVELNPIEWLYFDQDHGTPVVVKENTALTTTLGLNQVVKNQTPLTFDVTLANTYGADHNLVLGKFVVKNSTVSEIQKLEYLNNGTWLNMTSVLAADQNGTDVDGYFGPIAGFAMPDGYNQTSTFRVTFNTAASIDKTYDVVLTVADLGVTPNVVLATTNAAVTVDGTAPVSSLSTTPAYVTDLSKPATLTFNNNEPATTRVNSFAVNGTPVLVDSSMFVLTDSAVAALTKTGTLNGDVLSEKGTYIVDVNYTATDEVGNSKDYTGQIKVDTEAPKAVTGFGGNVNSDGGVVLTWTNPEPNDYDHLVVLRDGTVLATLPGSATTYTDTMIAKGSTYNYSVIAYDVAGNSTTIAPVSVSVPAPVAPAASQIASVASDSTVSAPATDQNNDKAVKSETDTNSTKDNNSKDVFSIWGIVLLVILAGVGGYLFLTQKPQNEKPKMKSEPVKPKAKRKPQTVKKK